jgi:hypothetical protein
VPRTCDRCRRRVYAVQNADGEKFLVDSYTGKRHCVPWRPPLNSTFRKKR